MNGSFSTILADPPWRFTNRTGKMAPEHQRLPRYQTMSIEAICALPVQRVAHDSCQRDAPRGENLKLRNRIIWHFGHGLHCTKRLSGRYETINWWTKSDQYTWNLDAIRVPAKYPGKRYFKGPNVGKLSGNPKGKNPSDVWDFPNVKNNHPEKTIHPCQFPVELVERLVLAMTDVGDVVLDPYMGVGSSIIAALMHDRMAYGCDVVPDYVDVARQRVREFHAGVLRTRPMGKPIYDPNQSNGGH